ncbi:MAG: HAD family hydrolase [Gemmatimonadetes bacterium]|jgi:FMN hydrolase / 5-amino-6-(5-phospho-D-ribitylamino)uracil phosphatase|nr:HAD family hydrolase [Gemmatimonadota bacterium]
MMNRSSHKPNLQNITTVSFDGDATLWDFEKVMRHSLGIVLEEIRKAIPGEYFAALTVDEMIAIRDQIDLESPDSKLEEIRLCAFERTLERSGHPDKNFARQLNELYMKHRFEDLELYPDVLPAFDFLAPRFQIGLLSNGNTYPEKLGLEEHFDFAIFAQDVGFTKPDPQIFAVTLEHADCTPEELLHVGDSLPSDVEGAQNAGISAVWLNRDGVPNETDIVPDFEIASLHELPALLP